MIRRVIMKRLLFAATMLTALMITVGVFTAQANSEAKKNDRATVEFTQTVKLLNVFLKGEYTVVHDEDRMAKGEDCTYVYDATGKLIVSFHCTPVERKKAESFRIVTARLDPSGLSQITEIQFAGSTEGHLVP
jgi:hypothetical protein